MRALQQQQQGWRHACGQPIAAPPARRQRRATSPSSSSASSSAGAAAASSRPQPPPAPVPLPLEERGDPVAAASAAPYGEYAWVRRAARDDPQRLLPHLSAENSFAAAAVLVPGGEAPLPFPPSSSSSVPDALARELGEWALSSAVGGLEDQARSPGSTTPPDAPPLAPFPGDDNNSAAAALCARPPLRGKRARRALATRLGARCLERAAFDEGPASARPRDACLSPCGRFLALLLPPPEGLLPPLPRVSVLCAETGEAVAQAGANGGGGSREAGAAAVAAADVLPLDASLAWASPGWGGSDSGQYRQHLFFLAAERQSGGLTVECLSVGGGGGVESTRSEAAAATTTTLPAVRLPAAACRGWSRAALARAGGGPLFAVGWAADGAPADAHLVLPPPSQDGPSANTALRFPGEEGEATATPGEHGQGDGGLRRCALSVWAGPSSSSSSSSSSCWVVARRWGPGLGAGGELMLGRASAEAPHWAPWAPLPLPLPLPDAAAGETLEAVFLPPPPPRQQQQAPAGSSLCPPPPPPYLVTLSVRPLLPEGLSSELVARRLDLLPPLGSEAGAGRWALSCRAEARAGPEAALSFPQAEQRPPPPPLLRDASLWQPAGADTWRLSNAFWDAEAQEVRADVSAMGSPPRQLSLPLPPAAADGEGSDGTNFVSSRARVLASTASPAWWAEAAVSRPWPRLWRTVAPSSDGARVPVTVLLPSAAGAGAGDGSSAAAAAGPFPLLLLAYGAYGAREPGGSFDPAHELLARRGWAVAVAHARGGAGACGARLPGSAADIGASSSSGAWHAAGKTAELKRAGIQDVLAVVKYLVDQGVADPRRVCLSADSAGAWVAVPAAAAAAAPPFCALLLTVPALCPWDEARVQREDVQNGGAAQPLSGATGAASDAAELGSGGGDGRSEKEEEEEGGEEEEEEDHGGDRSWDPYAACAARLASSAPHTRILLRTALDDRVVGFWEALCFAARVRRLRVEAAAAAAEGDRSAEAAAAAAASSSVLLRTLPRGGHAAYAASGADGGEEVLALAFLLRSIG